MEHILKTRQPPDIFLFSWHISLCVFRRSHHFYLSPLCCICEIQTLNTNIWKMKALWFDWIGAKKKKKKSIKDLQWGSDHSCVDVKMLRFDLHLHWANRL